MDDVCTFDDPEPEIPPPVDGATYIAAVQREIASKRRFELVPFDEIKMSGGPSYLVKGLIPREGLIIVWGAPKCGKSFLVLDLAMHVAMGWEYRGRRVAQGVVVYAALEGKRGFRNRVEAFRREKLPKGSKPPFHLMSASALDLVADQVAFIADIRAQLGGELPALIVLDTLNRSLAGSENDDRDMNAYVKAADAVRDAFGAAVVIVHHCGHGAKRPRGHSLLMGALDTQISVKLESKIITATVELSKDGEDGAEIVSRLVPIDLGTDEDGDAITSCVVEPADDAGLASANAAKAASRPSPSLAKSARAGLSALKYALSECGEAAPTSAHIPPTVRVVTVDQWRTYAYKKGISTSDKAHAKGVAFNRASADLIDAGKIMIWIPYVWII